ncbi:hypothetical protein ACLUEY_01125 [Vreelandella aquamarina]
MKEHGKLFSSTMVQAFLEGRKNQTRRVVDAHNSLVDGNGISKKRWEAAAFDLANATIDSGPSPAGNPGPYLKATCSEGTTHRIYSRVQPGDRIWVKETHFLNGMVSHDAPYPNVIYRADPLPCWEGEEQDILWRPSMFMPRWAARLVFDVVSVRLERLQDISEQDAIAEGCDNSQSDAAIEAGWYEKPRRAFQRAWDQINGPDSWQANPPVWIYDLQPVGIKPATMPSQSAPAECTLSRGEHATD